MNKFLLTAEFFIFSLLVSCARITQYTVSEKEINQILQKKFNNTSKIINFSGIASIHVSLTNPIVLIGNKEEPNKIILNCEIYLNIKSLFVNQKASVKIKSKAVPYFDKYRKAIYLREIEISYSNILPENLKGIIRTMTPYLKYYLNNYFYHLPIYVIGDNKNKKEVLVKKYAKNIKIIPGKIVVSFSR